MTKVSPAMTALAAATILACGLGACDTSPIAPSARPDLPSSSSSSASPPAPSQPAPPPVRVTGFVVDATDQPVAGARIVVPDRGVGTPAETITDAAGSYTLAIDGRYQSFVVEVDKD